MSRMLKQRRSLILIIAAVVLLVAVWSTLWIIRPQQPTLDQRVQNVGTQLKCLVCQGESVADSPSALAQQMRLVIREKLQKGESEQAIIQDFQHSYGDQIIWSPLWQGFSLLAWLVPILFWLSGLGLIFWLAREWRTTYNSQKGQIRSEIKQTQSYQARTEEKLEPELEQYRARLEAELASEDILFRHHRTEAL